MWLSEPIKRGDPPPTTLGRPMMTKVATREGQVRAAHARGSARQGPGYRFLSGSVAATWFFESAFACFSARFSFSDLPDFLVML